MINKKKTLTKEEIKQQERIVTANEFVNVRDIRGNILYSKDNKIFCYIKIEPLSIETLSQEEKYRLVNLFASEFSSENKKYKFFSISQTVDISYQTANIASLIKSSDEQIQKKILMEEMRAISEFATSGEVIDREFFLILWEDNKRESKNELLQRANIYMQKFSNCDTKSEIANEATIIKLCNLFANPSYAHIEDNTYEASIPLLKMR